MTDIPSGYQLSIISWENDGDNYKTKILNGLTKEDVKFYIHFLKHFQSTYGNEDVSEHPNAEKIAIESAWKKFPPSSPQLVQDVKDSIEGWKVNPNESYDWIYATIEYSCEGESYRVFESYKVHLIPHTIPDVTNQF
jgi:hypothetical protein